ncbi:MAG: HD domain-containing protein [Tagaea sp.]|nr:HD domain-containing protein [Tagaea sp.]
MLSVREDAVERCEETSAYLDEIAATLGSVLGAEAPVRVAVALYDAPSDTLHTFAESRGDGPVLRAYAARMDGIPSLFFARKRDGVRVIDDLTAYIDSSSRHTKRLLELGYRASYAHAVYDMARLVGVVFVNAREPGFFTSERRALVAPYAQVVGLRAALDRSHSASLLAAVATAQSIGAYRDSDTAAHLSRMSHFCRIIGDGIAAKYGLSDRFVELVFQFAPLHDIGKVGVPDSILLKPGKLTADEMAVMRGHVATGVEMVREIVRRLGFEAMPGIDVLYNVVRHHHEMRDGSGYPIGLAGERISIEGQILAVADIFDALTTARPYKEPWPVARALGELQAMAERGKLNRDCVAALERGLPQVRATLDRFADTA